LILGFVLLPVLALVLYQAVKPAEPPSLDDAVMTEAIWRENEEMNPENTLSEGQRLVDGLCRPSAALPDADPPHLFTCTLRYEIKATTTVDEEVWDVEIDDRGCWSAELIRAPNIVTDEPDYAGSRRSQACDPGALQPAE
jgi:hypothetical protein